MAQLIKTYQSWFFRVCCAQTGLKFKLVVKLNHPPSGMVQIPMAFWCRQGKYEISQNLTKQLILSNKDPKVRAMADQMPTTMHTFTEVCIHSQALLV